MNSVCSICAILLCLQSKDLISCRSAVQSFVNCTIRPKFLFKGHEIFFLYEICIFFYFSCWNCWLLICLVILCDLLLNSVQLSMIPPMMVFYNCILVTRIKYVWVERRPCTLCEFNLQLFISFFNGFLAKTYFNSNAQIIPFLNSSVFAALNVVRFDIMAIHESYIITTTFLIHYIDFGDFSMSYY